MFTVILLWVLLKTTQLDDERASGALLIAGTLDVIALLIISILTYELAQLFYGRIPQ